MNIYQDLISMTDDEFAEVEKYADEECKTDNAACRFIKESVEVTRNRREINAVLRAYSRESSNEGITL